MKENRVKINKHKDSNQASQIINKKPKQLENSQLSNFKLTKFLYRK